MSKEFEKEIKKIMEQKHLSNKQQGKDKNKWNG